jgi:DNA-binding NtrC family response regulator
VEEQQNGVHEEKERMRFPVERQMVVVALGKTDGNRSQAAKILGLTRQCLLNKIARYNIRM